MKSVGFIGRGRIASSVARAIMEGHVPGWRVVGALARDTSQGSFPGPLFTTREAFFAVRPDVIVEAAGPQALTEIGPEALAVADVWTISASALADREFFDRMWSIGATTGHRLRLLAGAFGGIDAVAALSALPGAEIVLTAGWTGPLVFVRWGISAAIVIVPFLILGRRLSAGYAPRTYRYAN